MSRRFEGFLLDYCRELTSLSTSSIKKLFAAVNDDSPRAGEPLLLLVIMQGREAYLMRQATGTSWEAPYAAFLEQYEEARLDLREFLSNLPDGNRYKKAYLAWMSQSTRLGRDRTTLANVAKAMSALIEEKEFTRAEACRKLKLDKGNF